MCLEIYTQYILAVNSISTITSSTPAIQYSLKPLNDYAVLVSVLDPRDDSPDLSLQFERETHF